MYFQADLHYISSAKATSEGFFRTNGEFDGTSVRIMTEQKHEDLDLKSASQNKNEGEDGVKEYASYNLVYIHNYLKY